VGDDATRRRVAVGVACLAAALLAACGGDDSGGGSESGFEIAEEIIEEQSDGEIDIDEDGEITVEGDNPFNLEGSVPTDFPEQITLPEGGELVIGLSDPGTKTWTLVYTGLDMNNVAAFRDSLVGDGFDIENTSTDTAGDISGFIAEGHGYDLVVGGSPDGFIISVMRL
jgi:hypothetical protein